MGVATADDLRARLRTRLEETSAAVWTDAELDECVASALQAYGALYPVEAIATAAVGEGATACPAPAGTRGVERVILADGTVVPRRGRPSGATAGEALAWEAYAGLLHFTQPLVAQTLTIWRRADVTLDTLPADDEELIVLGAVAQALDARAIQDYKRGGSLGLTSGNDLIRHARDDFERALGRRGRRVRGGMAAAT